MEFIEHPKMLYKDGAQPVVANSPEEEAALVDQGFSAPTSAAPPKVEKAKPCPKCPALQAQVNDLQAQVDDLQKLLSAATEPKTGPGSTAAADKKAKA